MSPRARTTTVPPSLDAHSSEIRATDTRAIEIATATERALRTHEATCREREERRHARAAEFRDEIRQALAELRTGLREVGLTIERLQWRIMTTLLSAVVSLLGLSGWLATKLLGW